MKLLFFDDFRLGVAVGDTVVDVSDVVSGIAHTRPQDLMSGVIERFAEISPLLQAAARERTGVALSSVRIRPPLPKPTNVMAMFVNYKENGLLDEFPIDCFQKSSLTIIGDGDTMILPDEPADVFEGEAELAVVIGRYASKVSADEAMSYVFGYTNFIDGSARFLSGEPMANFFFRTKSRETFTMIGPYIVTADEIADPTNLQVRQWNNGELKHDYNTSDMMYSIGRCIEFVTAVHPLEPGDLLALATNHKGLHPFQDGDVVEQEIEGLGRLRITVRDDLRRRWPRETRAERLARGLAAGSWYGSHAPQLSGKYARSESPTGS